MGIGSEQWNTVYIIAQTKGQFQEQHRKYDSNEIPSVMSSLQARWMWQTRSYAIRSAEGKIMESSHLCIHKNEL